MRGDRDAVVGIARVAFDTNQSLEQRVRFVQDVREGKANPEELQRLRDERDSELDVARAEATIEEIIPGTLVFVTSSHPYALSLGYEHARTVVAYNPSMPLLERQADGGLRPMGKTVRKFTICRWDTRTPTDIAGIMDELNQHEAQERGVAREELQARWGGRDTIIGSPQNDDTLLTVDAVIEIVKRRVGENREEIP